MNFDQDHGTGKILFLKEDIVICNFRDREKTKVFELTPLVEEDTASPRQNWATIRCEYFPRGFTDDDENYIAFHFQLMLSTLEFELRRWTCVVSIVNVEDQPKFSQSVTTEEDFDWDDSSQENPGILKMVPSITYPRFIDRRLLLDDDEEYIPGDTLKLRCEMEVQFEVNKENGVFKWALEQQHFIYAHDNSRGFSCGLNLRSPIYSSLCEECPHFDGMLRSGMRETNRHWMCISDNLNAFADMLYFIESRNLDHVRSASSLFNLYIISDRFLFSSLKTQCRRLISESLTTGTAPFTLALACNCNDKELKNSCSDYVHSLSLEEQQVVRNRISDMNREDIIAEFFQ